MTDSSLVDFYRRFGISPVRQNISDLPRHFARRAGLYRHLGILPSFVRGRSVIEIGPGSGFNSLYTASLDPSRYVLVEANPRGVRDIEELFERFGSLGKAIEIAPVLVEDYAPDQQFDFVLCEGMLALAGVPNPTGLLASVARLVAPGGVLVVTCIDAVSYFAETLRRLLADLLAPPGEPLDVRTSLLALAFGPHLATMAGMSRLPDDWIVDNLINPASMGPVLSIPDTIAALDGTFDVFGGSPRFMTDWRWYKGIDADGRFNAMAIEQYWSNVHNLLDYRRLTPPGDPVRNRRLYEACLSVREDVRAFERSGSRDRIDVIPSELRRIGTLVADTAPDVDRALRDVERLTALAGLDADRIASAEHFASWFGRGQQYLSFSRRAQ